MIDDADWPTFGWSDDVRPALAVAQAGGRASVLATLFRVAGSAPRGPGAQMLFDGDRASGYFSGDCIEGDVAGHAAQVLADGLPRNLHYGMGSPWIDIRLRCGGALHVLVERIAAGSVAGRQLVENRARRVVGRWVSDGIQQDVVPGEGPLLAVTDEPLQIVRRYDPPRRLIVSGGDPGALALAQLAAQAQFETILIRPNGPASLAPLIGVTYLRGKPAAVIERLGLDRWTAYVGATHEDHHDLPACLVALRSQAAWVGMIGARVRAGERKAVLAAAGATPEELDRLRLSPGVGGLGKAPWEVATGILAEVMQAMNPARERA